MKVGNLIKRLRILMDSVVVFKKYFSLINYNL